MPGSPICRDKKEFDLKDNSVEITSVTDELKQRLQAKDLPETTMIPEVVPGNPDVHTKRLGKIQNKQPLISDEGLILPRKPANPCLESGDRQSLHKELMFNKKIGKNVLNQKSELQRALEKHKDAQIRREVEKQIIDDAPELEKVIADRAKRLEEPPVNQEDEDKSLSKEFLEARAKLRTRHDSK